MQVGGSLVRYAEKLAVELEHDGFGRTARAYRTAVRRLVDFCGEDLRLEQINSSLMGDFQKHLKKQGLNLNSISFYMRTLRSIYNKAVAEKIVTERTVSPFSTTYTGVATVKKMALSQDELQQLAALEFDVEGEMPLALRNALAIFLFCYHARGMSFVDMAFLKKSDREGDVIRYARRKTEQLVEVVVHEPMRRILEWFEPQVEGSEYLFPVIVDSRKNPMLQYENGLRLQNERLKRVAKLLGINKRFSTQDARHSWATVAQSAGLPIDLISEGLGYQSHKKTKEYLNSLDDASRLVSDAVVAPPKRPRGRPRKLPDVAVGNSVRV